MIREILILSALVYVSISHISSFKYSSLEQKRIVKKNAYLKSACSVGSSDINSQLTINLSSGEYAIVRCHFFNNPGIRFSLTGGTLKFAVTNTIFTNCSTFGNPKDSSVIFFKGNKDNSLAISYMGNGNYFEECTFIGCGQAIYVVCLEQNIFQMEYISISNSVEMHDSTLDQNQDQDQVAITCLMNKIDNYQVTWMGYINYTYSQNFVSSFWHANMLTRMGDINIMKAKTRRLFSFFNQSNILSCINVNQIDFSKANPMGAIFMTESELELRSAVIFDLENVNNNTYLVYSDSGNPPIITLENSFTILKKTSHPYNVVTERNFEDYYYDTFGCRVRHKPERTPTPSYKFTLSTKFSASSRFSVSKQFSTSAKFSVSTRFSTSMKFSLSSDFTESKKFTASSYFATNFFSNSIGFTKSVVFSLSQKFTASNQFSQSVKFTSSNNFSTAFFTLSSGFSKSIQFSSSSGFTRSINFSLSSDFTKSNSFTPSNVFTPSDSKYVYFERMSKQAKLPSQTSQYGALSTTAMATVSTSVIVSIIIVGSVLMIFYVRQQNKNMIEQELPDLLQLPSDSSETSEECVISFSYSMETASREDDPFRMDPEYYLNLPC